MQFKCHAKYCELIIILTDLTCNFLLGLKKVHINLLKWEMIETEYDGYEVKLCNSFENRI